MAKKKKQPGGRPKKYECLKRRNFVIHSLRIADRYDKEENKSLLLNNLLEKHYGEGRK